MRQEPETAIWTPAPDGGRVEEAVCAHLGQAVLRPVRHARNGCEDCPAGAPHISLLRCLACGHVGCCDSSPGRHAHAHAEASSHPIAQSYGRRAQWAWCYPDGLYLVLASPAR
ncbi:UBP-type zinc finger domain-containing protein [Streptomyces sp. NPDC059851]|uniref:UBP-type zinc finger domain-containing protein n=1 Tax=Streptomyces sp. NPDC059851 TaxID=3346971 RepID=UPI00364959D2